MTAPTTATITWQHQHAGWAGRGLQVPASDHGTAVVAGVHFAFSVQHFRCRYDGIHAQLRGTRTTGRGEHALIEEVMHVRVHGRPKHANARARQLVAEFLAADPLGAPGVDCEDFDACLPITEDGERVEVEDRRP